MKPPFMAILILILAGLGCSSVSRAGEERNPTQTAQAGGYQILATQMAFGPAATRQAEAALVTATAAAAAGEMLAAETWPVIFQDTFADNHNNWPHEPDYGDLVDLDFTIAGGFYTMSATAHAAFIYWAYPDGAAAADFYLLFDARRLPESAPGSYGAAFRILDESNYYLFRVDDSGYYTLELLWDDVWYTLIPWTETAHLNTGSANQIGVLAQGSQLSFSINRQVVAVTTDDTLSAGDNGVVCGLYEPDDKGVFQFENFVLRAP